MRTWKRSKPSGASDDLYAIVHACEAHLAAKDGQIQQLIK